MSYLLPPPQTPALAVVPHPSGETSGDAPDGPSAAPGYWTGVAARLLHDPACMAAALMLLLIAAAALFAPLLAPFDPYQQDVLARMKGFGHQGHLLGTDEIGRDVLSRLIFGARVSLLTGVLPVLVATLVGGSLGLIAGMSGGRINTLIMRSIDVFYAFPSVLLAVAISGAMGGGFLNGVAALSLVFIPPLCRVAESAAAQIRGLDFIEAARGTGASMSLIIRYHVLRNVISPILVYASSLIGASILLASGLSFLGLGVQPPTADWGLMLSSLRQALYVQPWVCALPGVAIVITAMGFNFASDGVRAALDVKS